MSRNLMYADQLVKAVEAFMERGLVQSGVERRDELRQHQRRKQDGFRC